MSAQTLTSPVSAEIESQEQSRSVDDIAELRTDAQMLGASGIAAAGMIAFAHAELAAAVTAGLTAAATLPMWMRVRRLERAVVRSDG